MDGQKPEEQIYPRLDELERQQKYIPQRIRKNYLLDWIRRLNQIFSTYQALLTFTVAILTLVYVQLVFGVDPFESYRNTSTTKKLSEFYREMGDRLVYNEEYSDAETAYKAALTLQPNNTGASYGLAKAQIFTPTEGRKYIDTGTVNIKLDYLLSHFPNDADLYYLKCLNLESMDDAAAKTWCEEALNVNNKLHAPHIVLGYICAKESDLKCALRNYMKAVELNPESHLANNNLGFTELLQLNLTDAAKHLEKANSISTDLETTLGLGEVYRYSGDISKATDMHKYCLNTINEKDVEKERLARGRWLINFLPHEKNDSEMIKLYAMASTIDEKKVMIHYALAIDYALQDNFKAASREFESGRKLDRDNVYGDYFVNRCFSAAKLLSPSSAARAWLRRSNKKVCSSKVVCEAVNNFISLKNTEVSK